jgi:hypothetical protein
MAANCREDGDPTGWLALSYHLPGEPSRLRIAVWRRLKELGAVYWQQGVAILPMTEESERAFRGLREEVWISFWKLIKGD